MREDKRLSYYQRKIKELKEENLNILAENESLRDKNNELEQEICLKSTEMAKLRGELEHIRDEYKVNIARIKELQLQYSELIISVNAEKLKFHEEIDKLISSLRKQ